MQGTLHVAEKQFGYLVIWLGENEVKIEKVFRDDKFWERLDEGKACILLQRGNDKGSCQSP